MALSARAGGRECPQGCFSPVGESRPYGTPMFFRMLCGSIPAANKAWLACASTRTCTCTRSIRGRRAGISISSISPLGRAAKASAWSAPATSRIRPGAPSSSRSSFPPSPASTACAAASSRRSRRRYRRRAPVRFMLEVEISTIYKKADRTRKIHHLIYAPDFETVDRMSARLARIGNIASDGRPILGLDSHDLLEIALESGPHAYLVPAHIWTPWFAALGSQSGFDSIAECYGDLADRIFAVETGLSSDPPMNWRVSFLDRYRLTSNSDAHSPGKLGREATTFDCERDYYAIKHALETGHGYVGTVEFFPDEGKYHLDGHRKCEVRLTPAET